MERFARFFAHQIINIRKSHGKPVIIKLKGALGSCKTFLIDAIK